jgi:carboxylate-amine ligase
MAAGAYTIGIEEEYFLVDAETKTVAAERPEAFFAAAKAALGTQVRGELLQSQIEVTTEPHHDMSTARTELRHLRSTIAKVAADHGLAILAAGTHPTAAWEFSQQSQAERYDVVTHAALPAAVHRARHLVAVLALAADRADGLPARRL